MSFSYTTRRLSLWDKVLTFNWGMLGIIATLMGIGYMALYSAASGDPDKWAVVHFNRFVLGLIVMMFVALINIRFWHKMTYWLYFLTIGGLIAVLVIGQTGMGAQRWINLGIINLQPSEIMKITVIMALARYFNSLVPDEVRHPSYWIIPLLFILAPVGLVVIQPDLGTAILIMASGIGVFWLAGVPMWVFITGIFAGLGSIPVAWQFLHDYQKRRIMTFLDPSTDPQGAGYHITQSKIALGSGGFNGKGFMEGTQSHLNFLPEKQTDFIFTLLSEEWGFIGGLVIITLYGLLFLLSYGVALRANSQFARLMVGGLTINYFLYVFINIAMVMGLIPVVGVPLPLISFGGTAMLAVMIGYGLIISASIHRDTRIARFS